MAKVQIPDTVEKAWESIQQELNGTIISGGTLLQIKWEAGEVVPDSLVSLEWIKEISGIDDVSHCGRNFIKIGAMTPLAVCMKHPLILENARVLAEACKQIGSPAVRNRGSIGGNICSRIGDSIPALLAVDAEVTTYDGNQYRTMRLIEWLEFYNSKSTLLTEILIPYNKQESSCFFYKKIGRREAFTGALITVAICCKVNSDMSVENIRLCVGGGQNQPNRLRRSESFLLNDKITSLKLEKLQEKIEDEISSYTDAFATKEYRKTVAANLMIAYLSDLFSERTKG